MRRRRIVESVVVVLALLGLSLSGASATPGGPPNDNFADATEISSVPFDDSQPFLLASREEAEPSNQCVLGASVWYRFEPSEDTPIALTTSQSTSDFRLSIYRVTSLENLSPVSCVTLSSVRRMLALAGETYYIQAGRNQNYLGDTSTMTLGVTPAALITGTVTDEVSGLPIAGECVASQRDGTSYLTESVETDANGRYNLTQLVAGSWTVRIGCFDGPYKLEWYSDRSSFATADRLVITADETMDDVDAALARKGIIEGTVTNDNDDPLTNICVIATPTFTGGYSGTAKTAADGTYRLGVTGTGGFIVKFSDCVEGNYEAEYYNDKQLASEADPVSVVDGEATAGINAVLSANVIPANDDLSNAELIDALPAQRSQVIDAATLEDSEPRGCGTTRDTVWYRWIPTQDALYTADGGPSSYYVRPRVYSSPGVATSFADLTAVACSTGRVLTFKATAGTTYYLQFGSATSGGTLSFTLSQEAVPPHDNIAEAREITSFPFTETTRMVGATREANEPSGCYSGGQTVWYRFTGDGGRFALKGSSYSGAYTTITGDPTSPTASRLACSGSSFTTEAGKTYWIQVVGYYSTNATLLLEKLPPPTNDRFEDAAEIGPALPAVASVDTAGASLQQAEPNKCGVTGYSVWYRWTSGPDQVVLLDTFSSTYDTALAIYSGTSFLDLKLINCSDNADGTAQSHAGMRAGAGQTYFIQVASDNSVIGGNAVLKIAAAATESPLIFETTSSCAVLCPYWSSPTNHATELEAACKPTPNAPEGSWDDVTIQVPPDISGVTPTAIAFRLAPEKDYDGFICRATSTNNTYFIASDANTVDETCPDAVLWACEEVAVARVKPGDVLVLRVYNWVDTSTSPLAWYSYKT